MRLRAARPSRAALAWGAMALAVCTPEALPAEPAWPAKPVRMVIAGPAGGSVDVLARIFARALHQRLGQPFIADYRPGASGTLAVEHVARQRGDGHTLLFAPNGSLTEAPHTLKVRFDALADVKPLAEIARSSLVLVGSPKLPAATLQELIRHVRANPGRIAYASYGTGTWAHFAGQLLNRSAGLDMQHVAYGGGPAVLLAVTGGQVALGFDPLTLAAPLAKAGKIRVFGNTAAQRSAFLPEVPTFAELGYPQLDFSGWFGAFAPAATPEDLAEKIRRELLRAAGERAVAAALADLLFEPGSADSRTALASRLRAEYGRNAAFAQSLGLRAE